MFFESVETVAGLHFNTSKAFSRVCHKVLILKLFFLNIPGMVIHLVAAYLKYSAFYGNTNAADFIRCPSRCPWPYSVSGMHNGIPDRADNKLRVFADDTAILAISAPLSTCRNLATYITPQVVGYHMESLH
jgi:hypothetical protein